MIIKNIIFDLGVVVLNIDYNGPANVLKSMGVDNFEVYYSKAKQSNLFDDFEKGLISPDDFRESFKESIEIIISNAEVDGIWNAMILDFPAKRIELLKALKNNYRTFLLSNTNKIHYDFYTKRLNDENGVSWDDLFHKTFFSFEIGLRKPDHQIYLKALEEAEIDAAESLFIDDLFINAEASKACGINTVWLKEGIDMTTVFEKDISTNMMKPKKSLIL